jgi:hypothetical protein
MNDGLTRPSRHPLTEVVIPKEKAVFWMDDRGRWHNRHGRFEHKRIIDHFNHAIRRDADGYYVTQVRGEIIEKVYFTYADTALFVLRLSPGPPFRLTLNTGVTIELDPSKLFVHHDQLYQRKNAERIKFSEQALLAMAPYLEETPQGLSLRIDHHTYPIPDLPHPPMTTS